MEYEYDPLVPGLLKAADSPDAPDEPEGEGLITAEEFYDLLMEQQEQM